MNTGELVAGYERSLMGWGAIVLVLVVAGRVGYSWLSARQIWLLDSQVVAIALLLALAVAGGLFLHGEFSPVCSAVTGVLAWAVALSLIPRALWWQAPSLRADLADWLVYGAVGLLVLALIARGVMARRWLSLLRGHGHQWILEWARGKPYFARLLAVRVLASLGYQA